MAPDRLTRQQVLDASRGMLHKQLYVVFTKATKGLEPVMKLLHEHLDHQIGLERSGVMLAAGPHWTEDEQYWEGDGMFVIRAKDINEAREIAASDPMHKAGGRTFEVRPWLINEGNLTLQVTFSDGKMVLK